MVLVHTIEPVYQIQITIIKNSTNIAAISVSLSISMRLIDSLGDEIILSSAVQEKGTFS